MKKNILLLLVLAISMAVVQPASGQGFLDKLNKKLQKKVEDKIEKRAEEKTDEEIDKALDKILEEQEDAEKETDATSKDNRDQERLQKLMQGMGISGDPVPIADNYRFDSKIQMHIESYKANGDLDNEGDFITYINPGNQNFAYEFISGDFGQKGKQGKGLFIMDFENKAMIILSNEDGKKNGLVTGLDMNLGQDWREAYKDLDEEAVNNVNLNPYLDKTGRTKTIAGFKCVEYKYDNPEEDTEAKFWITKDADFKTRDYMSAIFKSAAYSRGMPWGFIMESEAINRETKERSVMKVVEYDENANKKIGLNEYQITNLGSMKIPEAE